MTYEHMSLLISWIYRFELFYSHSYALEDIEESFKIGLDPLELEISSSVKIL